MMLPTAVASFCWANPAGTAAGIGTASLGTALTRSVDIALDVEVMTPALAPAFMVIRMPPQMALELLLCDFLGLAVVRIGIRTVAKFDSLIIVAAPAPAPVPIPIPISVSALSLARLRHPEEAEHGRGGAAYSKPERLAAGPSFTGDNLCQVIEPSVVHV